MTEERCDWCGRLQFKPQQILERVSEQHGISVKTITSPCRTAAVVEARDCVIAQLWEHGLMLKEIGMWVGGRDHSTIIHALRKAGYRNRLDRLSTQDKATVNTHEQRDAESSGKPIPTVAWPA